jgi:hypothetical protein
MSPSGEQSKLDLVWTDPPFTPARSKLEAVTRISALTHSPPENLGPGSKEKRSVLANLAAGLGIDAPPKATKIDLGAKLAESLHVTWGPECWSTGQTITLIGLNRLLKGAARQGATAPQEESSIENALHQFVAARSKLEAVTRISALTHSPPETLGPGSKEKRSVLANLAAGLGIDAPPKATKIDLGAKLAESLHVTWGPECWSTGQTITLIGLNRLLEGAEWRVEASGSAGNHSLFETALGEALGILAVLESALPPHLDGRTCVCEMLKAEDRHWAQDEWAGFYFEFVGLPACINAYAGGPVTYANTRFDYSLGSVWDFKLHAAATDHAPLNAIDATRECLVSGRGVGFVVLEGDTDYDEGEMREWQREIRLANGKVAARRVMPAAYIRKSKRGFRPRRLRAFHVANLTTLDAAIEARAITVMRQGRQTSGATRKPKYGIHLGRAERQGLMVAQRDL